MSALYSSSLVNFKLQWNLFVTSMFSSTTKTDEISVNFKLQRNFFLRNLQHSCFLIQKSPNRQLDLNEFQTGFGTCLKPYSIPEEILDA